jgi:hypothetical protein
MLPVYGRPLLLVVIGTLMVLSFLAEIIFALVQRTPISLGFASWVIAAEAAAWHLKWVLVPVTFAVLWSSGRIYQSMLLVPSRFVGMRAARRGLMTSALVSLSVATLIGVTIPRRVREHGMSIEAGFNAQGYRIDRALMEYRTRNGTLPTELTDLLNRDRLPDPDGSIAAALANVDPTGYKTTATLAELPKEKQRSLRGAAILNVSTNALSEDPPDGGFSFTNYELPLPGDLIVRDGVIMKASEAVKPTPLTAAPARTNKR